MVIELSCRRRRPRHSRLPEAPPRWLRCPLLRRSPWPKTRERRHCQEIASNQIPEDPLLTRSVHMTIGPEYQLSPIDAGTRPESMTQTKPIFLLDRIVFICNNYNILRVKLCQLLVINFTPLPCPGLIRKEME